MSVVPLSGLLGLVPEAHEPAIDRPFQGEAVAVPPAATGTGARALADRARPRFASGPELLLLGLEAEQRGLLSVLIPAPRAADRGKLALVVEEAIECALEKRGACPPGVGAASDLDASLGDQLYRARLVELRGVFVGLGSLEGIAGLGGSLDVEDSAVLRFWLEAPRTRPVEVALEDTNQHLGVYGPPVALASLLQGEERVLVEPVPDVAPDIAASARAMELSATPPPVAVSAPPVAVEPATPRADDPALAGDLAQALVSELTHSEDEVNDTPEAPLAHLQDEAEPAPSEPVPATAEATPALASEPEPASEPELASEPEPEPVPALASAPEPEPQIEPAPAPALAAEKPVAPSVPAPPLDPSAGDTWPTWLAELERARGPKPLAAVERMFVGSYVPLRDAYLRGIAPAEVGAALEGWAASFAKSYTDAFDAMRVRGKRPSMVLDIPDAALRIGRLHGARSVQLLLVDGMRFDLGLRAERLLRERLGSEVALTERLLLWSALPSDTNNQLSLLGRGPDGLREIGRGPDSHVPVARGRMASTPRRIKTGHRELLKLDLVEARLAEPGPREAERLDGLAHELTAAIAELCEKLPTRTLLVAFGDHGFVLDPQGEGTGAARHGGARPEEVLVPAFAWLVGGVQ